MRNKVAFYREGEAGFGVWHSLFWLTIIILAALAILKMITVWVAIGLAVAAIVVIGLLANASDIGRYMRISSM